MTNLSKIIKNWVLKKYDGKRMFVTEGFAKRVIDGKQNGLKGTKYVEDDRVERWLDFSAVSEVMPAEAFYKESPELRPVEYKKVNYGQEGLKRLLNAKHSAKGILKGLENFINQKGTVKAESLILRDKIRKRVQELESESPTNALSIAQDMFGGMIK